MPSLLDLAAKLADSLKDSEFRNHPDRIRLHTNRSVLQRIQWIRFMDVQFRDYERIVPKWKEEIRKRDLEQYELATKLCKKLKIPYKQKKLKLCCG